MFGLLWQLFIFPFKLIAFCIELLVRSISIISGLIFFGIGALLCQAGPMIIIGAPLCLVSVIVVLKAFLELPAGDGNSNPGFLIEETGTCVSIEIRTTDHSELFFSSPARC